MYKAEEFIYEVMAEIANIFDKVNALEFENEGQFNMILKAQILFLSKKFNLMGKKDFKNSVYISPQNLKSEYINVLWYTENTIIAAFEITSNFINKPVAKLNGIDAAYKFWIYYGEQEIPKTKKIINDFGIHIVRLVK